MFGPYFKGSDECECCAELVECYVCPCLAPGIVFRLIADEPHLELENAPEDWLATYGNPDLMAGLFEMEGGVSPPNCVGCFDEACGELAGARPRIITQICPGGIGTLLIGWTRWYVRVDTVNNTIDVFLAFVGEAPRDPDCEAVSTIVMRAYIRWRYSLADNACASLASPTHVSTHLRKFDEGELDVYSSICGIAAEEDVPNVGDLIVNLLDLSGFGDPETDPYWKIASLTPPRLEFDLTGCVEPGCCADEGGGPNTSFDWEQENCRFNAHATSTPGTCGAIVKRLWELEVWDEDPNPTPDDACPTNKRVIADQEDVFGLGAQGCGQKWMRLTLHEWDEAGCYGTASSGVVSCCNCTDENGEPCADPPGSLIVTQPDPENFPCRYVITANIDDEEYEGVCDDTAVIEWRLGNDACDDEADCSCQEIEDGDCGGGDCSGTLADGESHQLDLEESTTLYWRAREASCGCWGPWNEETLFCTFCECCDASEGQITGAFATVGGIGNGTGEVCGDCDAFNDEYYVPQNEECGGTDSFERPTLCEPFDHKNITVRWWIECTETEVTLRGRVTTGNAGPAQADFAKTIPRPNPDEPIDCTLLEGALTQIDCICEGSSKVLCDATGMTLAIEFEVAA